MKIRHIQNREHFKYAVGKTKGDVFLMQWTFAFL